MADSSDSRLTCQVCNKAFSRSCKLHSHMKVHLKEETHVFGGIFPPTFELRHHGDRKLYASTSRDKFVSQDQSVNSSRGVSKSGDVEQSTSENWRSRKRYREDPKKRSRKTSAEDKPFLCAVCGKGFGTKTEQRIHTQAFHTYRETPQSSAKNRLGFKRRKTRSKSRAYSASDRFFRCLDCVVEFEDESQLIQHLEIFHVSEEQEEIPEEIQSCKSLGGVSKNHVAGHNQKSYLHLEPRHFDHELADQDKLSEHTQILSSDGVLPMKESGEPSKDHSSKAFHTPQDEGTGASPAGEKGSPVESRETAYHTDGQNVKLSHNKNKRFRVRFKSQPPEVTNIGGDKASFTFPVHKDKCVNSNQMATHAQTETCSAIKKAVNNQGSKRSRKRPTRKLCRTGNQSCKRSRGKFKSKSGKVDCYDGENQRTKDSMSFFSNREVPVDRSSSNIDNHVRSRVIPKVQTSEVGSIDCDKKIEQKDQMAKHYQEFHSSGEIINCGSIQSNKGSRGRSKKRTYKVSCKNGNREVFACICDKRFASKITLARHAKKCCIAGETSSETIEKEKCVVSPSILKSKAYYKQKVEDRLTCFLCDKKFLNQARLTKHYQVFHADENVRASENCRTHMKLRVRPENKSYKMYFLDEDFLCPICNKSFPNEVKLVSHYQTFHVNRQMKTEFVAKSLKSSVSMEKIQYLSNLRIGIKQAKRDASGKVYYECEVCFQRLTQASSLKSHLRKHTGERPYVCKICNVSFSFYQCLWNHSQKHTGKKSFQCQICSKSFVYYQTLWGHERKVHAKEKSFNCNDCGEVFVSLKLMKDHTKQHLIKKQYECKICKKKFKVPGRLLSHSAKHIEKCSARHNDKKCYNCDVCGRRFKRLTSLQNHKAKFNRCSSLGHCRDNSKISKRHGCSVSVKKLSVKPTVVKRVSVRLHIKDSPQTSDISTKKVSSLVSDCGIKKVGKRKAVAKKEKSFVCHICNKAYASAGWLQIHMKKFSRMTLKKCDVCEKFFHNLNLLKQHRKVHGCKSSTRNKMLRKLLKSSCVLGSHNDLQFEEMPFECLVCNKKFKSSSGLKMHSSKHSDLRPYGCTYCDRRYKLKSWLIRHCQLSHKVEGPGSSSLQCWECGTIFVSEVDMADHQKPMVCQICHQQFHCSYIFCSHTDKCSSGQLFIDESLFDMGNNNPITAFRNRHIRIVINESKKIGECESSADDSEDCADVSENSADQSESELFERAGVPSQCYFPNPVEKYNQEFGEVHLSLPICNSSMSSDDTVVEIDKFNTGTFYASYSDSYINVPVYGESLGYRDQTVPPQDLVSENDCSRELIDGYHYNDLFECDICSVHFTTESEFATHRLSHFVGGERHHCIVCDQTFSNITDLTTHAMTHITII